MRFALLISVLAAGPALAGEVTLRCTPELSHFCANIHVGCAGRSKVAALAFELRRDGEHATLHPERGPAQRAIVTWSSADLIFWNEGSRDWLRLEPDGRYSQRIYLAGRALMARGRCVPVP